MFESLLASVEKAFVEFNLRRAMYLIFLCVIGLGGLWVYNETTGYGPFSRIDHQISILERLQALEAKGIDKSTSLGGVFRGTVAELAKFQAQQPNADAYIVPASKFFAGSCIPLLFVVYGLAQLLAGNRDGMGVLGGAAVCVILFGVPSVFLPVLWNSLKFTILLLLGLQLLALALVVRIGKRKGTAA